MNSKPYPARSWRYQPDRDGATVQNVSDQGWVSSQEVRFGAPHTTLGQFSHLSPCPDAAVTAPAKTSLALPSINTRHFNHHGPHFNKHNEKWETCAKQLHLCLDLYYFPPLHYAASREISQVRSADKRNRNRSWFFHGKLPRTSGRRCRAVQKAWVRRIRDTFLFHPCFSTNSYKSSKLCKEPGNRTVIPAPAWGYLLFPLSYGSWGFFGRGHTEHPRRRPWHSLAPQAPKHQ